MNMMEIWDFDGTDYKPMFGFDYDGPYSDFVDLDTGETIIEPLDPFVMSEWGHGDQVAKAFFEQLDNPADSLVLAIDYDFTFDEDFNYLFGAEDPDTGNTNFEELVNNFIDEKNLSFAGETEFDLIGYSFSWGGTDNSHLIDDIDLFDLDSPIFTFAEPNVGVDPSDPSYYSALG